MLRAVCCVLFILFPPHGAPSRSGWGLRWAQGLQRALGLAVVMFRARVFCVLFFPPPSWGQDHYQSNIPGPPSREGWGACRAWGLQRALGLAVVLFGEKEKRGRGRC